jgi:peptidoglycan/xylan/chitin deacetylase (PgdA/CDA1 family)
MGDPGRVARDLVRSALFTAYWRVAGQLLGQGRVLLGRNASATVAITLDDGPTPEGSLRVAERLASADAKATFFCIGEQARRYPEILRRLRGDGHVIGSHTYHHRKLVELTTTAAMAEIDSGRQAIEDILGEPCPLFRPPHGRLPLRLLPALRDRDEVCVLWSYSLRDFGNPALHQLKQRLLARGVRPGDILLLHDSSSSAAVLIDSIVSLARVKQLQATAITAGNRESL